MTEWIAAARRRLQLPAAPAPARQQLYEALNTLAVAAELLARHPQVADPGRCLAAVEAAHRAADHLTDLGAIQLLLPGAGVHAGPDADPREVADALLLLAEHVAAFLAVAPAAPRGSAARWALRAAGFASSCTHAPTVSAAC